MRVPSSVLIWGVVAAGAWSVASCRDDPGPLAPELELSPEYAQDSELEFVKWTSGGPPLSSLEASVKAVRGRSRVLTIYYRGSDEFLTLEIDDETLWLRPDKTPFRWGESVEIRAVVDEDLFMVTFYPPGLVFKEPAELRINYEGTATSFAGPASAVELWRQEKPGRPWVRVRSVRVDGTEIRAKADLGGFTRFALAIGR